MNARNESVRYQPISHALATLLFYGRRVGAGASEIIIGRDNIVANYYEESLSHAWFVATRILPTSPCATTYRPSTVEFSTLKQTRLAARMAEAATDLQQQARKRKRKRQCTAAQKRLRVTTDHSVTSETLYSAPLLPVTTDRPVTAVPLAPTLEPTSVQSAGLCLLFPTSSLTSKSTQCIVQDEPLLSLNLPPHLEDQRSSPTQVKVEFDLDCLEELFTANPSPDQPAISNLTPVKLGKDPQLPLPATTANIAVVAADPVSHRPASHSPSEPPVSASSSTSVISPLHHAPSTLAFRGSDQQSLGRYMITQERLLGFAERPVFHHETMETLSSVFEHIKDQTQLDRVLFELSNLLNGTARNILNGRSRTWGTFAKVDAPSGMIRLYDRMTRRIHVTHGKKNRGKRKETARDPRPFVKRKRARKE
ncbi:hypothetical protein H4R35_000432 [Dimargaris xerosporica]|nr:hypothetical protein H4R35_000432 [Dimargaris xerosporica]